MEKITENPIIIISGEGERGTIEQYTGKKTQRAIKRRLTKEQCNGERWAKAVQYLHDTAYGDKAGVDLVTGELQSYIDAEK